MAVKAAAATATAVASVLVATLLLTSLLYPYPLFIVYPRVHRLRGGLALVRGSRDCSSVMSQGSWTAGEEVVRCTPGTQHEFATCSNRGPQRHWRFSKLAQACGARRLDAVDARKRLAGQTVVFAGDSVARLVWGATLRLLGKPGAGNEALVPRHHDLHRTMAGNITLQYTWAPYPSDMTAWLDPKPWLPPPPSPAMPPPRPLQNPRKQAKAKGLEPPPLPLAPPAPPPRPRAVLRELEPALMLVSVTLWHMINFMVPNDFSRQMAGLVQAATVYRAAGGGGRLVFATSPETFPGLMKERKKKLTLIPANLDAYNQVTEQAGLLQPEGPFGLLNLFPLTQQCGAECSVDGYHSRPEVYDAALQILLNIGGMTQREHKPP